MRATKFSQNVSFVTIFYGFWHFNSLFVNINAVSSEKSGATSSLSVNVHVSSGQNRFSRVLNQADWLTYIKRAIAFGPLDMFIPVSSFGSSAEFRDKII